MVMSWAELTARSSPEYKNNIDKGRDSDAIDSLPFPGVGEAQLKQHNFLIAFKILDCTLPRWERMIEDIFSLAVS